MKNILNVYFERKECIAWREIMYSLGGKGIYFGGNNCPLEIVQQGLPAV